MGIYRRDLNYYALILCTLCSERMRILRWLYEAIFYFKIPIKRAYKTKGCILLEQFTVSVAETSSMEPTQKKIKAGVIS
jgi:hypothetical protein